MSINSWIDGVPATTNQGVSIGGGTNALNELSLGAQHRSSGYLRNFTGDVQWAALLYFPGPTSGYTFTDEDAWTLYNSGYPFTSVKVSE